MDAEEAQEVEEAADDDAPEEVMETEARAR